MENDSGDRSIQVQDGENNDRGKKVLFLSVKKDTRMRRRILWLIGSKNLKAE